VVALTDAAQAVTDRWTYDAFGGIIAEQGETPNLYNFVGALGVEGHIGHGLLYMRQRYYDPVVGRFLTEDPIRDGLNWYAYCGNNPVNGVDPTGLFAPAIVPVVVIAIGLILAVDIWPAGEGEPAQPMPVDWEVLCPYCQVVCEPFDWGRTGYEVAIGAAPPWAMLPALFPFVPGGGWVDDAYPPAWRNRWDGWEDFQDDMVGSPPLPRRQVTWPRNDGGVARPDFRGGDPPMIVDPKHVYFTPDGTPINIPGHIDPEDWWNEIRRQMERWSDIEGGPGDITYWFPQRPPQAVIDRMQQMADEIGVDVGFGWVHPGANQPGWYGN